MLTIITAKCRRGRRILAASIAAGLLLVGTAEGRPIRSSIPEIQWPPSNSLQVAQRGGVSLQEAVRMASRRYQGRVVRAATIDNGGRRVHEIRILLDEGGRVVTMRIDAQTGESR